MKVVLPLVFSNSISLMAFSVRASKAEVGSSKMRMSGSFNKARAMVMRLLLTDAEFRRLERIL